MAQFVPQYDALVVQPCLVHEVLNSDENQPARVWREGRAKATGVCGKIKLYPEDAPGHSSQAEKDQPTRHSSEFRALDWWLAAGCGFGAFVPASMHPLRTRVARRTRRQPEEGGDFALCVRRDIYWAHAGVRLLVIGTPNRH